MKKNIYIGILFLLIVAGSLFFLYQESWLILDIPYQSKRLLDPSYDKAEYQKITICAWTNNRFEKETGQILKTKQKIDFLVDLMSQYLKVYREFNRLPQATHIQSAIVAQDQNTILISFNQTPFDKQASTFEKLMFVSGLLQTLKENHLKLHYAQLLVNHQPLKDSHLNFLVPLPIHEFDPIKT